MKDKYEPIQFVIKNPTDRTLTFWGHYLYDRKDTPLIISSAVGKKDDLKRLNIINIHFDMLRVSSFSENIKDAIERIRYGSSKDWHESMDVEKFIDTSKHSKSVIDVQFGEEVMTDLPYFKHNALVEEVGIDITGGSEAIVTLFRLKPASKTDSEKPITSDGLEFTRKQVIDLLVAERKRAVDIAYEFKKKNDAAFREKKGAGNDLAFVKEEVAEECRIVGNTISGLNAISVTLKVTEKDLIEEELLKKYPLKK